MFKLSPSSLSLMQECPRCFWLEKHKVWKRPVGIFSTLPSGMDLIIKRHFDRFREICQLPPEVINKVYCEDMKLFNNTVLLNIWRDNFKGLKWQDQYGNVLSGAIDDLLQEIKTGKVILIDFKTRGFSLRPDTASYYQDKLDIYGFLLCKNKIDIRDFAFLLFYIPKKVAEGGSFEFYSHMIKMQINSEHGKELFEKAIQLLNGPCPRETCKWCESFGL